MCGIFGVVSTKTISVPTDKMIGTLSHRGPDSDGFHQENCAYMGHKRLRIIDLEGGHQPIYNEDRTKCIIFNGEIYNYLELRKDLIRKGHQFSTRSDTEVILHAYEQWGESCVEYLRGMFAFAIWDTPNKRLFLARDRLGIKPLFYAAHKGRFYFASEMKAILADESFPREIDEAALACYFTLSYIPAPLTIYSKIKKLLPGHLLSWEDDEVTAKQYWDIFFCADYGKSEDDFIQEYMVILEDSVKMRLMSEVPLGAFLSGGIDSSTVVALMSRNNPTPVNTFSIGFGGETGGYLDEREYAKMVSEQYSTNHNTYKVIPDLDSVVEKIVKSFDEPFADDTTIPSYYVCKMARENVTVALSGLGGDEAFAGYEKYLGFKLRRLYNLIPGYFRHKTIPKLAGVLPERLDGHYTINHIKRFIRAGDLSPDMAYFSYLSILNPMLKDVFFSDQKRFNTHYDECKDLILGYFNSSNVDDTDDSLNRALFCDFKSYLPEDILAATDRMSMQHSLEVRVPFIDHKLLELCATIPPNMKMKWYQKKYLLKKGVKPLLPKAVINHRKQGFVGPMAQWLKKDLRQYATDTLSDVNLDKHGLFNGSTVQRVLNEHLSGREIHDTLIWSLIIFQKWYDIYIEKKH